MIFFPISIFIQIIYIYILNKGWNIECFIYI